MHRYDGKIKREEKRLPISFVVDVKGPIKRCCILAQRHLSLGTSSLIKQMPKQTICLTLSCPQMPITKLFRVKELLINSLF